MPLEYGLQAPGGLLCSAFTDPAVSMKAMVWKAVGSMRELMVWSGQALHLDYPQNWHLKDMVVH